MEGVCKMKIIKQHKAFFITSLIVFSGLLIALVYSQMNTKSQVLNVYVSGDQAMVTDLESLVSNASIVVRGQYVDHNGTWNAARNSAEPSKEASDQFVEAHLFTFEVDEVLKGNVSESTIEISHHYADAFPIYNEDGTEYIETVALKNPLYTEPHFESDVFLFIQPLGRSNVYYGAYDPFIVEVADNDQLRILSPLVENENINTEQSFDLSNGSTVTVSQSDDLIEDFVEDKTVEDIYSLID